MAVICELGTVFVEPCMCMHEVLDLALGQERSLLRSWRAVVHQNQQRWSRMHWSSESIYGRFMFSFMYWFECLNTELLGWSSMLKQGSASQPSRGMTANDIIDCYPLSTVTWSSWQPFKSNLWLNWGGGGKWEWVQVKIGSGSRMKSSDKKEWGRIYWKATKRLTQSWLKETRGIQCLDKEGQRSEEGLGDDWERLRKEAMEGLHPFIQQSWVWRQATNLSLSWG